METDADGTDLAQILSNGSPPLYKEQQSATPELSSPMGTRSATAGDSASMLAQILQSHVVQYQAPVLDDAGHLQSRLSSKQQRIGGELLPRSTPCHPILRSTTSEPAYQVQASRQGIDEGEYEDRLRQKILNAVQESVIAPLEDRLRRVEAMLNVVMSCHISSSAAVDMRPSHTGSNCTIGEQAQPKEKHSPDSTVPEAEAIILTRKRNTVLEVPHDHDGTHTSELGGSQGTQQMPPLMMMTDSLPPSCVASQPQVGELKAVDGVTTIRAQNDPLDEMPQSARKRKAQQCTVCKHLRFSSPGHTLEGWCPIMKRWGDRSTCASCDKMRWKSEGHTPDGFCPVTNTHSTRMADRWRRHMAYLSRDDFGPCY